MVGLVTDELDDLVAGVTTSAWGVGGPAAILGTVTPLLDGLLDTLLAPIANSQNSLTGAGALDPLLDPAFDALDGIVSLVVNAQSRSNGEFTERALVVRVLPGANELVRLNLASASVGPGAGPEGDDDDDGDNPSFELPHTGAAEAMGLGAAGLALAVAGAAAAGASRASRGRHARS